MNRIAALMLAVGPLLIFAFSGCSGKSAAVQGVEKMGGRVYLDKNDPDNGVISVDLSKSEATDDGLQCLEDFGKLQSLNLMATIIGDDGLEHLQGLTALESLDLRETKVTGVRCLRNLTQLQTLELGGTEVSDAGLQQIGRLTQLQTLGLTRCTMSATLDWNISAA